MSTWNNLALAAVLAFADAAWSQGKITLPDDSPLTLLAADWSQTQTSERGGAMVVDLHTALSLRNASPKRVRGLTLLVSSQEVAAGGRGSVTKASLDVAPGENFPVRIDLRLLRPLQRGTGPLVEITLDGVLFDDLTFYGPNRLESRRVLTAWEMEAQRDRRWFRQVLERDGMEGLRKECIASLARQADTLRLDVQMAQGQRTTAAGAPRNVQLAFLRFPDSPVEAVGGAAQVFPGAARFPRVELENHSQRAVRHVEIGWLLRDSRGREYAAGATSSRVALASGGRARLEQDAALTFTGPAGAPVSIDALTAFVSQVEFEDGSVWLPSRSALADSQLRKALAPSAEEQRLTAIYRKRGLSALAEELKKF